MPPHGRDEAVEVLLELPGQTGLSDSRDADDRQQVGLAVLGARVEELLDHTQLAVTADERRLESGGAAFAAAVRDHAERPVEVDRLRLALQLVRARVLVGDRCLAPAARALADEDRARLGGGLDAGGRC